MSLACDWSKLVVRLNTAQQKLQNIRVIFPNDHNCACCVNKRNGIHLAQK